MTLGKLARPLFGSWYHIYAFVLVILLGLSLLIAALPVLPVTSQVLRVQPALLELAAQQPTTSLSVIVQKQGEGDRAEKLISDLGGTVTTDLHLINAFAAVLPARSVTRLEQSEAIRWVSLDAPVVKTAISSPINTANLQNAYIKAIGADKVWNRYQGEGVGVAVVDSGVNPQEDLYNLYRGTPRLVASMAFNDGWNKTTYDSYGHGTHVAGIIGGNGNRSGGAYIGVAPSSNLINVKVSDDTAEGVSKVSNVVAGLEWVYLNRKIYNIRVINISINGSVAESYNTSPLCAAVEALWFSGIVVVVSAGNGGSQNLLPPANDPYVITVGATDDQGTPDVSDDTIATFSAYGKTSDGYAKPDLVAPGTNIVSLLAMGNSSLALNHADHVVSNSYFKMSGTSVAAPIVAGTAALVLEANPNLTPDQVKYRLTSTARPFSNSLQAGAGYLNAEAAVNSLSIQRANINVTPSRTLGTIYNSVTGSSANWSSANWSSANWSSANWSSTYWGN